MHDLKKITSSCWKKNFKMQCAWWCESLFLQPVKRIFYSYSTVLQSLMRGTACMRKKNQKKKSSKCSVCGVKKKSTSLIFESVYQYNERKYTTTTTKRKQQQRRTLLLFSQFSPNAFFTEIVTWSHEYSVVRDKRAN